MRIEIEKRARADIRAMRDYVAKDNPQAALMAVRAVRAQVATLSDHSGIGRPGRIEGTRELVITGFPYIVCYVVEDDHYFARSAWSADVAGVGLSVFCLQPRCLAHRQTMIPK